jgi:hypothetical protein
MNIDQAAEYFGGVQWRGTQRFIARCPAHQDKSPSLSVREGHTNIMVKCFAGCTFFEVAAAVGLEPMAFKIGDEAGVRRISRRDAGASARSRLRQVLRRPELVSLADVASLALRPSDAQLTRAAERYPTLIELPYEQAMTMDRIVEVGPMYEWLWDGVTRRWNDGNYYPRYDTHNWYEARDKARKEMAETWRRR